MNLSSHHRGAPVERLEDAAAVAGIDPEPPIRDGHPDFAGPGGVHGREGVHTNPAGIAAVLECVGHEVFDALGEGGLVSLYRREVRLNDSFDGELASVGERGGAGERRVDRVGDDDRLQGAARALALACEEQDALNK